MAILVKQWIENAELESLLVELKKTNEIINELSEEALRIDRSIKNETEPIVVKQLSKNKRECQVELGTMKKRYDEIMKETSEIERDKKIIIDYGYYI